MSNITIEKFDDALKACEKGITRHTTLSYFILILIFGYTLTAYLIILNGEAQKEQADLVTKFYRDASALNTVSYVNANKTLSYASMLDSDLRLLQVQIYSTRGLEHKVDSVQKYIKSFHHKTYEMMDSLKMVEDKTYSYRNIATTASSKIIDELTTTYESPAIFQYVKYLLNFIVIGVLIFIYKFHLNQSKKYEHYLFALTRIKIANDSNSNLNELSKLTLISDAFSEHEGKNGTFDSPLDGHPISDTVTDILNKILDKVDNLKK